ncbi:MAG: valine--tRNA ligase, partial [Proteobacteria bacterium]|nr:valine--tRNA ligase [Pseudomonadota bacterium]
QSERQGPPLMLAAYPEHGPVDLDAATEVADIRWIKNIVGALRNIRGEQDIPPNKAIPILFTQGAQSDRERQSKFADLITALVKTSDMSWLEDETNAPPSAIQLVGTLKILVPLAGLIDTQAEIERLDKAINKIQQDIIRVEQKLANEAFVNNAPADIVEKEKAKIQSYQSAKIDLENQKARIAAI